jgi:SM-20-related protein
VAPALDAAIDEIASSGWTCRSDLVATELVAALRAEASGAFDNGRFRPAGVGRGADLQIRPEVRSDRVLWIDPVDPSDAQAKYLALMEELRLRMNRELQLGLFEFEGHLAIYPPGAYYRRHLDQTRGTPLRTVTCITYLNEDWAASDGGQLRIWLDDADRTIDLEPHGGRTVLFLSDRFEHEVLPSHRERASLTGWFRRRPL